MLNEAESTDERTLLERFFQLRVAVQVHDRERVDRLIDELERRVEEQMLRHKAQATALADANVRSVSIVEQQEAIAEELKRQNQELALQKQQIEASKKDLEAQATAIADANVDVVLLMEQTQEEIEQLEKTRENLLRTNQDLSSRAEQLRREADALAAANVEAVTIMEQKEATINELERSVEMREIARKRLEQQVFKDALTGLFNQRYFAEQIGFECARALRYGRDLSLLFIDVDHFKVLNDTHGHPTGDKALKLLGELIASQVRGADVPVQMSRGPVAVRYGGEEFVIILPETTETGAAALAERLRSVVENTEFEGGSTQPSGRLTISAGVAGFKHDGDTAEQLVKRADNALYAAKEAGRNRVHVDPGA